MRFFKNIISDLNQARKDVFSGVNDLRKEAIGVVASDPLLSGVASIAAGAFGGPLAAAAVNGTLAKKNGASWGRALATGGATYGLGKLFTPTGPQASSASYSGTGTNFVDPSDWAAGTSSAASAAPATSSSFGSASGWGLDDVGASTPTPPPSTSNINLDDFNTAPRAATSMSSDQAFGKFLEDYGLADIGGGKQAVFGAESAPGFENNLLEGTRSMYDDLYTDPNAFAGYSDAIPASTEEFFTSPTLRQMFSTQASNFMRGADPYLKVGRGLNDLYAKNRMASDLRDRQRQIDDYRMTLENRLNSYYAPGSAEAEMLRSAMERRDAAAGRNSQYGTREVNLAGEMANRRAQYAQSMAPSLTQLMAQGNSLGAASSALRRGQLAGLWQTGGALRDMFK